MTRALPVLVIAGVALTLRAYGLDFGLPILSNLYIRPDETLVVVSAVELVSRGGDPGHLNYPALMMNLLAMVFAVQQWIVDASTTVPEAFAAHPSRFFLVARWVSALAGALTAVAVLLAARVWTSTMVAMVAALWVAVSPLAVRESHFAVTDTLLALLVLLTTWSASRWIEQRDSRARLLWTATLAGLAAATKYNAGVMVPALAVVMLFLLPQVRWRARLAAAVTLCVVSLLVFLICNPMVVMRADALIEWLRVLVPMLYQPRPDLAVPPESAAGINIWTRLSLMPGGSIGAVLAFGGAMIAGARLRRDPSTAPLLAIILAFALLFAPTTVLPLRYLAPLLPLTALLAAIALQHLPLRAALIAGAVGVVVTVPQTWRIDQSLAREDSRSEAGRWIAEHVPVGVPLIWLGAPEAEPQLQESAASLARRIGYVEDRYGAGAARVIDRPYLLLQADPAARRATAREVFRNVAPDTVDAPVLCVVSAEYPLPMIRTDAAMLSAWTRGHVEVEQVIGDDMIGAGAGLEPSDAFFLPLPIDRVYRPGPRITVRIVRK